MQGGRYSHGGENPRNDVGDGRAAFDRRPAGSFPGIAHQGAHALGDQIESGALGIRARAAEA